MDGKLTTPADLKGKAGDWRTDAWQDYSAGELAQWVMGLSKRAKHRNPEQRDKIESDLTSAGSYQKMLDAHLDKARAQYRAWGLGEPPAFAPEDADGGQLSDLALAHRIEQNGLSQDSALGTIEDVRSVQEFLRDGEAVRHRHHAAIKALAPVLHPEVTARQKARREANMEHPDWVLDQLKSPRPR